MHLASPIFKSAGCKGIPFVAAHKLILNVSKIRLRLICARASYLYRLFAKALALQLRHGWRWFHAETSSHCELVAHECTRMYIRGRGICGVAILCGKFLEKHANIRIFLAKNLQKSYKDLWR